MTSHQEQGQERDLNRIRYCLRGSYVLGGRVKPKSQWHFAKYLLSKLPIEQRKEVRTIVFFSPKDPRPRTPEVTRALYKKNENATQKILIHTPEEEEEARIGREDDGHRA